MSDKAFRLDAGDHLVRKVHEVTRGRLFMPLQHKDLPQSVEFVRAVAHGDFK
jgi:hypothetical protein